MEEDNVTLLWTILYWKSWNIWLCKACSITYVLRPLCGYLLILMSKYFMLICITPCLYEGIVPLTVTVYSAERNRKQNQKHRKKRDGSWRERLLLVIYFWHNHIKNKRDKTAMVSKRQELHSNGERFSTRNLQTDIWSRWTYWMVEIFHTFQIQVKNSFIVGIIVLISMLKCCNVKIHRVLFSE